MISFADKYNENQLKKLLTFMVIYGKIKIEKENILLVIALQGRVNRLIPHYRMSHSG